MKPSDVIKERGWCKNIYENDKGQVCLSMAINLAIGKKSFIEDRKMANKVISEIFRRCSNSYHSIEEYNDAPSRRKNDVLNLLEKLGL